MKCPLCGKDVRAGRLRAHKEEEHGEANVPTPKPKLKSRSNQKSPNDFVKCGVCSLMIKRRKLASHKRAKHPTRAQRLKTILDPDEQTLEEFKKRKMFVSGGGFGVGKGKKK